MLTILKMKKDNFFISKIVFIPRPFIKDFQAPAEAFSTQKRTSSTLKHEFSSLFQFLGAIFCPPGSGSTRQVPRVETVK
jgi:hypothetical protein